MLAKSSQTIKNIYNIKNKYTKLYSGGTTGFVKDNILQIIPIDNVANLKVGPTTAEIITRNVDDN